MNSLHQSAKKRQQQQIRKSGRTRSSRESSSPSKRNPDQYNVDPSVTPSIFAMMASKRLAKQLATKMYAKRADSTDPEPSYQMQPMRKFDSAIVCKIVKELVEYRLKGFKYTPRRSSMMVKVLSEEIKDEIKLMEYDRYKIVCMVTLGEKNNQDLRLTSRCAWDVSCDNSATFTWQNMTSFCSVTVFGVYHE